MAFLLRCLFFLEARYDLVLQAWFIPGVEIHWQMLFRGIDLTYSLICTHRCAAHQ